MKLRFQRRARSDLDAIYEYVATFDAVAAQRLLDRIGASIARLRDHPRSAPARDEAAIGMRVLSVAKYNILYRIDPDAVVIVRIIHSARDLSRIDLA
ncbi:type II toxin-antitoxin system RelE/ParE family toxin [Sphingomonas sp. S1-29]|uniref:type II toxin-antitoxin system RelE/ParE family toxin n=1 Tax=Sphingomonas sp. S1-29 TaxID=2991074 RepID=UPI002240D190|nr:type II toxin-antitoxin system RelE/ParE family toxin [Sphingomonas sp. S1-29]UZK69461.1 type II toxin-antitoxin system RelE/ParE family toxin [Sphingomonas sp. S1-29]